MFPKAALLAVLLAMAAIQGADAWLKEKKLAKFFLLGAALAPRAFIPVPIPE